MRLRSSRLFLALLVVAPSFAQQANVSVSARSGLPYDPRPFGKYLIETCTLAREQPTPAREQLTLSCAKVPYPRDVVPQPRPCSQPRGTGCKITAVPQLKDQTVTIKVVCDPAQKTPCDPMNPKVGADFFVSASSDSGLQTQQRILLGNATPLGGLGTVHYRANAVGPIVIRATAPEKRCGAPPDVVQACDYAASPPVDLILQVSGDSSAKSDACPVLPASVGTQSKPLDAPTIVSLLGNPTPFLLSAEGSNTIFIYATRLPLERNEPDTLGSFQQAIAELAGRTAASLGITLTSAKPFSVELRIPHWSALGDLATRIGGLNYSQFNVQDVGRGSVRVTAPTPPDCDTWKGFLTDIREMAWQVVSAPMSTKLFYLSSSDVATAFSGLVGTSTGSGGGGSSSGSGSSSGGGSGSGASSSAAPSSTSASAGGSGSSANASIAITQPPGSNIQLSSDTTPCVVAGLAFGSSSACGSTQASSGNATSSTPATSPAASSTPSVPPAMSSVAVAAGTGEQTPPDLLVYSDTNPGDDAQIEERNRVLAQLDLPRPEMILSAWVTQNSTTSPQAIGAFNNLVKGIVADYNGEYENVVLRGWVSIKEQQSQHKDFFNEPFRSYISDRFVADTNAARKVGGTAQDLSQAFLDQSQAKMADPVVPRSSLGICDSGRYCLGYFSLFPHALSGKEPADPDSESPSPIKPALTDLLLAIIAAQKPDDVLKKTVQDVQGTAPAIPTDAGDCICDDGEWYKGQKTPTRTCQGNNAQRVRNSEVRKRCHAIWRNLDLDHVTPPPQPASCEELDFRGILGSLLDPRSHEPIVHLECFRQEAERLLAPPKCGADEAGCNTVKMLLFTFGGSSTAAQPKRDNPPYGVGLFRAAIADFLFNYKMSQQYPHEFVPYDLTQSANNLNNALSPLIDAFNRDLWSYQMFVRADMQYQVEQLNSRNDERCCVKRLFGLDKPSFFNDGLVTVRTISGQPTSVSTTSQSFLNTSTAPELSALLSSLSGSAGSTQGSGSGTSGGTSAMPSIGGQNFGLIASALANYQTSFAQIGRQLSFTATPRSLATASSAEIAVSLNADESANLPAYTGPGANDPAFNTSRVANHDTSTRVRVDSIKLFEVSSFSAIVERSRSRFPLLPPFVEIPYIGTFAGIPLGSAREFHSSTAIISAYVVPTAADIAYGLHFVSDLAVDALNPGSCSFYKGASGPDVKDACVFRKMFSVHDAGYQQPIREFNKNITRCFATDTSSDGCQRIAFANALQSR
jgi:hypothetical protein